MRCKVDGGELCLNCRFMRSSCLWCPDTAPPDPSPPDTCLLDGDTICSGECATIGCWAGRSEPPVCDVKETGCSCTLYHLSDCPFNHGPVLQSPPPDPFFRVLQEILSIHEKKSHDYGSLSDPYANIRASVEFGVPGWVGAVLRANDKTARIKSYVTRGELVNESVRDALLDAAGYYLIALTLYDEENS